MMGGRAARGRRGAAWRGAVGGHGGAGDVAGRGRAARHIFFFFRRVGGRKLCLCSIPPGDGVVAWRKIKRVTLARNALNIGCGSCNGMGRHRHVGDDATVRRRGRHRHQDAATNSWYDNVAGRHDVWRWAAATKARCQRVMTAARGGQTDVAASRTAGGGVTDGIVTVTRAGRDICFVAAFIKCWRDVSLADVC